MNLNLNLNLKCHVFRKTCEFAVQMSKRPAQTILVKPVPFKKPMLRRQSTSLVNPPMRRKGLQVEKKDITIIGTVAVAASASKFGNDTLLNGIPAGAGNQARIGRKINLKSLHLRGAWTQAAGVCSEIRIVVIYDRQTNSALATSTDVFIGPFDFTSQKELAKSERFITLIDEVIPQGQGSAKATSFNFHRKLNLDQIFNPGNGATVGDIQTGSIVMMFAPNDTLGGSFEYSSRIRFTDV